MAACDLLIIPGWGNSGPGHWQSLWANELPNAKRIEQKEWINVRLEDWVDTLASAVLECQRDVVLVGHSLSCILVAHWAQQGITRQVRGALLVAPTDVEDTTTAPVETHGFAPIPLRALPFRSIVVASTNDPYVSSKRAAEFADGWGSTLVNIGDAGHINVAAGFGHWPRGEEILATLVQT